MRRLHNRPNRSRPPRPAFTIIELLIVIAIIMILLSIIVVAVNAAMRSSQAANTQALMTSINQGLVQFRSDVGYLPPILGARPGVAGNPYKATRDYAEPPVPPYIGDAGIRDHIIEDIQPWSSITSIPEYLLGYGNASEVGAGSVPGQAHLEQHENDPPLGIRHPGSDGFWGVAYRLPGCVQGSVVGTYDARKAFLGNQSCEPYSASYRRGRIFGPYIELRDERLLGAVVPYALPNAAGQYQVFFPGDALPAGQTWESMPKVIVDYWGQPLRYFRKPYVRGSPGQEHRQVLGGQRVIRQPTLADVYVLRPWYVDPGDAIDVEYAADATTSDTTATRALRGASFALLSAGPDRRINMEYRADPEEHNRDNIVELGR